MAPHFQLKIKSLKFISAVDRGAQGPISNVALIKRAPTGDTIDAVCKVVGLDQKLGLVFGWALATSLDGGATPHVDLQDDAIVGGDELIKVAAAFMEASAASDVLHDDKPDGKIVFAMPLTKDVKAALAIKSDVEGLAIAMRPSPETFARFVSKELNAFSIGGTGERIPVGKAIATLAQLKAAARKPKRKAKPVMTAALPPAGASNSCSGGSYKRVGKRAVLTSVTDGHAHALDLDDPADSWSDTLSTTYQTSEGATESHSHAWVYDATTGAITIALDSGHTHMVSDAVPPDVLAEAAADDDSRCCGGCGMMCDDTDAYCPRCGAKCDSAGIPTPVEDEPSSGKTVVIVSSRAPAGVSPPSSEPRSVTGMDPKIAKMLALALALPETQRSHVAKLAPDDQIAFIALDHTGREGVVKSAQDADPVVHTTKSGLAIRKSAGEVAVMLAKQNDAHAEQLERQAGELAVSKAATEQVTLEKRAAADLSHFAKAITVRAAIVKAIDGIADEAVRKEAHEAIKGANAGLQLLGKAHGAGDEGGPHVDSPIAKFEAGRVAFAKAKLKLDTPSEAQVRSVTGEYIRTTGGEQLYADAYPSKANA